MSYVAAPQLSAPFTNRPICGTYDSIIQGMQKTGTRRLLIVSGFIVADEGDSPFMRYLLKPRLTVRSRSAKSEPEAPTRAVGTPASTPIKESC